MRGQGSIYARGDALWVYIYSGGDRRVSVAKAAGVHPGQATWTDAVKVLKELIDRKTVARRQGSILLSPRQERVTIAELAADYIARRIAQGVKRPQAFKQAVGRVVTLWGSQRALRLTTDQLWRDVQALLEKDLKRSTIKTYLAQLHAILVSAGEQVPRIPKMPALETGPLRRTVWTEEEVDRLCTHARPWVQDIVRFGFLTGWRISEVLDMTWDRVDRVERLVYLDDSKTDDPRVRPYDLPLLDLSEVIARRFSQSRLGCPLVFHVDGLPITNERFYRAMNVARERAGIGDRIFHDFRRRVADFLQLNGVDLFTVQELLGHKSMASTRRYTRQNVQRMRSAMDRVVAARSIRLQHMDTAQPGSQQPFSR